MLSFILNIEMTSQAKSTFIENTRLHTNLNYAYDIIYMLGNKLHNSLSWNKFEMQELFLREIIER